jgi:hypothetical protein
MAEAYNKRAQFQAVRRKSVMSKLTGEQEPLSMVVEEEEEEVRNVSRCRYY